MRAAVYLRQSLDKTGDELAISRQRTGCVGLCETKGWTWTEFVDNDRSASNGKVRPAYQAMLSDITEGKLDAVVSWDLDRLHRQPIELESFIAVADEHRVALATVTGDVDLATDNGRLYARIKGAVARAEVDRKSARQRAAARQKAELGRPQWKRAFGYTEGPNGPEPDPQTAPLVRQAYADVLAGTSLRDIARSLNAAGHYGLRGKPWTQASVSLFLRKPRNAGLRAYNGEVVGKGNWTALVDETTWRATQSVMAAPGRAPGRKSVRRHLLTGLLHCGREGCDGTLAGQWVRRGTAITYQCRGCFGLSIRAEHIEPMLYKIVGGRLAMPDAVDLLKAELHDTAEAEAIRAQLESLYVEVDNLAAERAEGLLTGRQLKVATDVVLTKITALERSQQDQERLRVFDGIPLGKPEAAEAVTNLTADRYRAVLDVLMCVTIGPVGKINGRAFRPERVKVEWR